MSKFKLWIVMKLIGNKPFVANIKIREDLYFRNFVIASDFDGDGHHICGLLCNLFDDKKEWLK